MKIVARGHIAAAALWIRLRMSTAGKSKYATKINTNKNLSYRRETARCVVSVEILPVATQQYKNYLYNKSWTNRSYEVEGLQWIWNFYGRSPGANMCHCAKFHQNRPHGCRDMAILWFLKWRPSAILDFWNSNFVTVVAANGPSLHQRTKFRKDRSNRCGDVAIFVIFQDGGRRHLGFSKIWNFNGRSAVRVKYASLYQISSNSVKRLQRYGDFTFFFKMAAVRHLGFVERLLGPPTTTTWWSPSLCKIWSKSMQEFR